MNSSATPTKGMLCPTCRIPLAISERHGVEIDYCPECRGVWLDRGELDKIIERAEPLRMDSPGANRSSWGEQGRHGNNKHGYDKHGYDKHRRRRSFLSDLFD